MPEPIIITTRINATPERIWKALTDRDEMQRWYFEIPDFKLEEGAVFNFYEPGENKKYHHRGEILSIIPNQLLQHTWTHPSHSQGSSILTWRLAEAGDYTEVTLEHDGVENFANDDPSFTRESYEAGWNELVTSLLPKHVED